VPIDVASKLCIKPIPANEEIDKIPITAANNENLIKTIFPLLTKD
jgi:hypothetical protein